MGLNKNSMSKGSNKYEYEDFDEENSISLGAEGSLTL